MHIVTKLAVLAHNDQTFFPPLPNRSHLHSPWAPAKASCSIWPVADSFTTGGDPRPLVNRRDQLLTPSPTRTPRTSRPTQPQLSFCGCRQSSWPASGMDALCDMQSVKELAPFRAESAVGLPWRLRPPFHFLLANFIASPDTSFSFVDIWRNTGSGQWAFSECRRQKSVSDR